MNPKYQIFISSTYEDLKDEREQVLKAILRLGHIPIGMEMFNAANETQWEMIKRRIEESDYYIVIIAHRYGSIEQESGLSYTEKEYDYANSIGIPTLGFVLGRSAAWPGDRRDDDANKQMALKKFIEKVEAKMRSSWSNKDELASAVSFSLNETMTALPRVGWVRADQVVNSETINEMTRLSKENAELREHLLSLRESSQNAAPMPQINIDLKVVEGKAEWYEFRQDNSFHHSPIARINQSPVELKLRQGFWLRLVVSNRGTLATDLSVKVNSDSPIVDSKDMETFDLKDEGLFTPTKVGSSGWSKVEHDENCPIWSFIGNVRSLKPGQDYEFAIPLTKEIFSSFFEHTVIGVNIFPVTGKHIEECFALGDITSE